MTLLDRIKDISDKMQILPLSQIVPLLMPIAFEFQDYESYGILYCSNSTIVKDSNYDIRTELIKIFSDIGLTSNMVCELVNNAVKTSIDMRTMGKDKVISSSIIESENMIKELNQLFDIPHNNSNEITLENKTNTYIQIIEKKQLFEKYLAVLQSFVTARFTVYYQKANQENAIRHNVVDNRIEQLLHRFRIIANQLKHRYNKRTTIEINDEYDVQDLLHALLKIDFDDVRAEEWTPSYAGSSSRMDFFIKDISTVIEVKMTRDSLTSRELGEQLIVDTVKYQEHPDCKKLYCFVYDPEMRLGNPIGLKKDLESKYNGFLNVIITS
ncbi:MAG: hypothetical protein IJZ72_02620 [Oscillospiraceae bacterium]|nr:hypothetical protein [Oscillospiraceae bacterium]